MRPQVETALRARGVVLDGISGIGQRFSEIFGYRVISVTADNVVVTVNYRNRRAVPGSGHATGEHADISETATFRNLPPTFPLVGVRPADSSAPRPAQSTAAQSAEDIVRQNWPTLKSNAEAFMAKRGAIAHPQSGYTLRFNSLINNYKVASVTPTTISLEISMLLIGTGGGPIIIATTAAFQNQPGFAVIRID